MANTPNVQAILEALKASQSAQPAQQQQQPPAPQQHAYPGQSYAPTPPVAAPGYNLPQPSASGSVDLSSIKPVGTGTFNYEDVLAKARGAAAERGIQYDPNRSTGPARQDPRLANRSYPPRERSRSPPRREQFHDNSYNPYRDERRADARRGANTYSRSRSPPARNNRGTFSPQRERGGFGGGRDEGNQESIMIDSPLVGLVIGRQGENLRRIEAETNTRIQFITTGADVSGPQRECKISGPLRARDDAKREIYRIIDEHNGGNAQRNAQQQPPPRTNSAAGGGKQRGSNQPPLREGEDSIQIMVPDRTVGLIIGRGGETIRDLQERSGCHINIVGENKSVNGLRPVNLIGSKQASDLAKELILEIVDSDTRNQDQQQGAARPAPYERQENRDRAGPGPDKITEKIHVPSDAVGMIIGKGGETIKSMQAETGCKINVTQPSGADNEREIGLVGSAHAIQAAKDAIWDKVDQVKEKNNAGGGGRGGGRNTDHYDNYSQQQSSGQQQGYGQGAPQAGAPGAGGDAAADPYAPWGGYQNYMLMWQLAQAQQQAQGQAPPGGAPPGA